MQALPRPKWGVFFEREDAIGTIGVLEPTTGRLHVYNPDRASWRLPPASTFKIYNSLVLLESGVVPNADTIYAWDGVERGGAWDLEQSLRTAFRRSAVWLFQDLAERAGRGPYLSAFQREPYGNGIVGDSLRTFWLAEPLAISALEQIEFLDGLVSGRLAFSGGVQETVRSMMLLETEEDYSLYAKTGWSVRKEGDLGWIVGWLERDGAPWIFALNVEAGGPAFDIRAARRNILDGVLADLDLRPDSVRPSRPRP